MICIASVNIPACRVRTAIFAAGALVLALEPQSVALAQTCAPNTPASSACAATPIRRSYEDATRSFTLEAPAGDSLPWISQTLAADPTTLAPIAVNPTDAGVNARASLNQIRDYNAQATARKIEAAKAFAPKAAPNAAPPVAPQSELDVWTSFDAQGLEGQADQSTRAAAGADYKLTKKATVGVAAERGATVSAVAPSEDQKVSASLTYKAAPALSFDARTQWEEATGAGATTEKRSVSIAPRVGRTYALEDGRTIEPFLTYRQEFGFDAAPADPKGGVAITQSTGAGVTYVKPDGYSVSVTTDVERLGAQEPPNLSSKLQLKLPIN